VFRGTGKGGRQGGGGKGGLEAKKGGAGGMQKWMAEDQLDATNEAKYSNIDAPHQWLFWSSKCTRGR
jgi:hypothetical protein